MLISKLPHIDFEQLIERGLDGKLILHDRQVVYANDACIKLLGIDDKANLIGNPFDDFLHPDFHDICKVRLREVTEFSRVAPLMEQKIIRYDGGVIDVEIMAAPYFFNEVTMSQVIIRDITEKKKSEKLLMQNEKLSLIGELATGIVHEIRNPLTSIKGFIQLIETELPNSRYTKIVLNEIKQIEDIANDLLYLSKPDGEYFEFIHITEIIEDTIKLIEIETFRRSIKVNLNHLDSTETLAINGDRRQLKQVFLNILKNAMEAIEKDGKMDITIKKEGNKVRVSIRDTGIGIPKNKLKNIGQSFYTNKKEGTGLGLMVTQNIMHKHHGEINIESEEGNYTIFSLTFPLI